jgi:hypothetical protein
VEEVRPPRAILVALVCFDGQCDGALQPTRRVALLDFIGHVPSRLYLYRSPCVRLSPFGVRQHQWMVALSEMLPSNTDMIQVPRALLDRFTDTLTFAA